MRSSLFFPAGGLIGEILQARLGTLEVPQSVIPISGITRESFTVDEIETRLEGYVRARISQVEASSGGVSLVGTG